MPPRDVDELTRQQACAEVGHDFPIDGTYGSCARCGLTVNPPPPDGSGERRAA
jgi:hypothetical protein